MTGSKRDNYYAILMAGGVGSRFWPASKTAHPKQFHDVLGYGESLFQTTFKRLSRFIPVENIYVLTNENYVEKIKEQIPEISYDQIVPEPEMRNTAPSILLGSLKIFKKNPEALTIVAPCDHWIKDEEEFIESVKLGFDNAEIENRLVTLGIEPTHPNTGYGYIRYNKKEQSEIKKVEEFTEKPTMKVAQGFLDAGNYVWNAGIFIWKARAIIESFKKHLPEMYALFDKGGAVWNTEDEKEFLISNYGLASNISIDYGIMEKSEDVYVIPVDFHWSDLGTWSSVQNELPQDEYGNTCVNSRLLAENSENNIVAAASKKIVVLKGLSDFIIVEDEDVLMIVPKSEEQEIKQLRQKVIEGFGEDLG